jgi:acyl carrier protein
MLPTIGCPISNSQIYILDGAAQPSPIGVTGEICIGGAGLARGYFGRPETTAQRFLADPFSREPGARLYRTGDIGRWTEEGAIEYLGRNDDQVKIRGYRIELGEIAAQLVHHMQVKDAAVIARDDAGGSKRLVAYVTLHRSGNGEAVDLRTYLQSVLPEYMIPGAFVVLDNFPLTPNGKLDRRALPEPDTTSFTRRGYEAPRGEIEEAVAAVWRELLKVDRIGRRDNFFELGGHSLLATRVVSQISNLFDVELSLRSVFDRPTIEGLSDSIVQAVADDVVVEAS